MLETIITSSVLIAAVIFIRAVFKNSLNRRLRYALWGIVLLRLLVPVQLLESPLSILNAMDSERVEQTANILSEYDLPVFPIGTVTAYSTTEKTSGVSEPAVTKPLPEHDTELNWFTLSVTQIIVLVWACGALAVAVWFAVVNAKFKRALKNKRQPLEIEDFPLPVYRVDMESSPCLFGLFRPSVYVTPKVLEDEETLKYVLAHELTHYKHFDYVWAFLRIICLSVYWFNPLVWVAAWLSRVDCEQACDESVVKQVGDGSRIDYGRTIVALISPKPSPDMIICTATTMAAGKNSIKKRITAIAANRKTIVSALIAVTLLMVFAAACTFTGAAKSNPWQWASGVNQNTLYSAEAWSGSSFYVLSYDETQELSQLINVLDKGSFTENTELVGGTPEYGIIINVEDTKYNLNESIAPAGSLEMEYEGKMWWIDSEELNSFILNVVDNLSANEDGNADVEEWSRDDIVRWGAETAVDRFSIPSGDYADYDEVARSWAEAFVRRYVENTSDDSPLKSADAAVLSLEPWAESLIGSPKRIIYNMRFACNAEDARGFERWFSGWAGPLYDPASQYDGWMEFGWIVELEQTEDGGWVLISAGTGGYGGWGYLNSSGADDFNSCMTELIINRGEDFHSPENLLATLPFVNWKQFESVWRAEGWSILLSQIDKFCLTQGRIYGPEETRMWSDVYPDDQAYRNMYVMLTALNTDGAYSEGISNILAKQKNYDSEIFDYCLEQLTEEQRDTINMLVEYAS
ncbi:MAG TPA: M56 family metallopeptidase [Clostridiaceae bacterium]|nr:M56 family metallopeptidase [Clostridiaceae bacterium]